jgi:hypothetical protein
MLNDDSLYYLLLTLSEEDIYMVKNTCTKLRDLCLARFNNLPPIGQCVGSNTPSLLWAMDSGVCLHKTFDKGLIQWINEQAPDYMVNTEQVPFNENILMDLPMAYNLWCIAVNKRPYLLESFYDQLIEPFGKSIHRSEGTRILNIVLKAYDINLLNKLKELCDSPFGRGFSMDSASEDIIADAILNNHIQFAIDIDKLTYLENYCSINICEKVLNKNSTIHTIELLRIIYDDAAILLPAGMANCWTAFELYIEAGRISYITPYVSTMLFRLDRLSIIKKLHKNGFRFQYVNELMVNACSGGITASAIWLAIHYNVKYHISGAIVLDTNNENEIKKFLLKNNHYAWDLMADKDNIPLFEKYFDYLPKYVIDDDNIIKKCSNETIAYLHNKGIKFSDHIISYLISPIYIPKIQLLLTLGYKISDYILGKIAKRPKLAKILLERGIVSKQDLIPFITYDYQKYNITLAKMLYNN